MIDGKLPCSLPYRQLRNERFQNKRIKQIDEESKSIYYENYEPCDVPDSRWIDMLVEMPSNLIYNQRQAEAERLAKEAAKRDAKLEAASQIEDNKN
ncbi:phage tail fiber protein [Providencia stuartii]|uniref:phage tail fiber protein n=1 Tax=Providencia stuartii TaxID=588 RepID=UPI003D9E0488